MLTCNSDNALMICLANQYGVNWKGSLTAWPNIEFTPQLSYSDESFIDDISIAVLLTNKASKSWAKSIPSEIVSGLIAFEQLWNGNAYLALYLTSHSEEARNLFVSNMGLFWYISKRCEGWHPTEVLQLFREQRKKILDFLELPEETAVINLFKKLYLLKPTTKVLRAVSKIIKSGTYKELSHVKLMPNEFVRLLAKYPVLSTSNLIQRYQPEWECDAFSSNLRSIMKSAEESNLGSQWVIRKLSGRNPERVLENIEYRLYLRSTKQSEASMRKKPNCQYPRHPIAGDRQIDPIAKYYDLLEESKELKHCAQDYHEQILDGSTFFYRMNLPERATIQVSVDENGALYLEEIKLKGNDDPDEKTRQAVFNWLAASGKTVDISLYLAEYGCDPEEEAGVLLMLEDFR